MMNSMVEVKVCKVPGRVIIVALNGERTVADAIEAAEIDNTEGYEVRVNSTLGSMDTILCDGDTVVLAAKIRGQK